MDEHLLMLMNTSLRIVEELKGKKKKKLIKKTLAKCWRNFRNPSQAVLVSKLVSELELEVMFSAR